MGAPTTVASTDRPRGPSLVALDVGHGVAVLLRGGRGGSVLYDAGGRMPGTAERIVVPALRALGVRRLTAVAISHEDSDHSAAVPDLVERMPVGVVLVPAGFGGEPAGRRVLRACARRDVPVVHLARGDAWAVRDVALAALHPAAGASGPAENEGSLVLHATLGGPGERSLTALLPGDVEGTTLDALAADRTLPPAEVLLLPHHGRGDAAPQLRLAALCGARVLIASTPETARTAVPGALLTGREGALLVVPGRAPIRLVPDRRPPVDDSGL
jgi:competence protein ComEC